MKTKTYHTLKDIFLFGKYKGKTIEWIIYNDLNYILWAKEKCSNMRFSPTINKVISDYDFLSK